MFGSASDDRRFFQSSPPGGFVTLAGAESTVETCPCPALLSMYIGNTYKTLCICHLRTAELQHSAWFYLISFSRKKSRTVQVLAFFCFSCTRQPASLPVVMMMVG
ncbi:hypothetical protein ACNKHS_00005 [Shigella flexneri]